MVKRPANRFCVAGRPEPDNCDAKETGPRKGPLHRSTELCGEFGLLGSEPDRADGGEDADDQQQGRSNTVDVRERHFGLSSWGGGALGEGVGAAVR